MDKQEQYLGENLNRSSDGDFLILDGRERANPAAVREVPAGTYLITRTEGSSPGTVWYWGMPA